MVSRIRAGIFFATCAVSMLAARGASAQVIDPFYAVNYTFTDIGNVPGLPSQYGGLTFKYHDTSTILIGGGANSPGGYIYSVGVVRGEGNHITGFSGMAVQAIEGAYNDGGVAYGPKSTLFLARWPVNELGQVKLGSAVTDKVIGLAQFNVVGSPGGLNFVPPGQANAGKLKMVSWSGGQWYDVDLAPDGTGTYDISGVTLVTTITGGPEGFLYAPPKSPLFPDGSLVVSEYSGGSVGTYETDANGNPIVATRKTFMTGLTGAEGAATDPLTGDYLFSTFGGGSRVIVVKGFALPLGAPCQDSADCGSGTCADGVCCDSACDAGACDSCTIAGGAPEEGACTLVSNVACDDGNLCSGNDMCQSGECIGSVIDCIASDDCHETTGCDAVDGCGETAKPDGAPCAGGTCANGACVQGGTGGAGGAGGGGNAGAGAGGNGAGAGGAGGGLTGGGGNAGAGTGGAGTGGNDPGQSGGCGCRTSGNEDSDEGNGTLVVIAMIGLVFAGRRKELARPVS